MAIDFKGFKKVHDDDDKAIMRHPKGHEIVIAKVGLSHKLRRHLSELPLHKDEGGAIEDKATAEAITNGFLGATAQGVKKPVRHYAEGTVDAPVGEEDNGSQGDTSDPRNTVEEQAPPGTQKAAFEIQPQSHGIMDAVGGGPQAPQPSQALTDPSQQQVATNFSPQEQQLQNYQGYKEATNAVNLNNQIQTDQFNAANNATKQHMAAQADLDVKTNAILKGITDNIQKTTKDIGAGHINPNHLMQNTSVLGKIGMAVGMILAGYGTKGQGPNPALTFLNQQIDRDVEAQKADLGNKRTLLEAYQKQYGDTMMATNMTKATLAARYADQLSLAATQDGSDRAKVNSLNAQAEIYKTYMPALQKDAALAALRGGSPSGGQSNAGTDDAQTVAQKLEYAHRMGLIDPGQYSQATKDLDIASKTKAAHEAVDDIMTKIAEQQTFKNKALNPIQSHQNIASLHSRLVPLIMDIAPSKRLTSESAKMEIEPNMPGFTTSADTAAKMAQNLHDTIDALADKPATLNGLANLGIRAPKYSNQAQQQSKTATMNGMQYTKVPGGWQKVK